MSNPQDSLANHPQGSLADHPQNQLIVRIHDLNTIPEGHITFVVLLARYQGKWVYVRHKERTTWEIPGGHREPGEWLTDSAERELYEETGATVFTLDPLFDYEVDRSGEDLPTPMSPPYPVTYFQPPTRTFGRLYLAEIQELGTLPEFEIAEVRLFDDSPEHLTYPAIQPMLLEEGTKRLAMAPVPAKDKMLQLISPLLTAEPVPFSLTLGLPESATGGYARITRRAVRLVAIRNDRILLVRNRRQDVKFPGGGMEPGETELVALQRECLEETGHPLLGTPRLFGTVVERHYDGRLANALFEMTSQYYVGEVGEQTSALHLDAYEADLAFEPVWMPLSEACESNLSLVAGPASGRNRWVIRDTAILLFVEQLLQQKGEPDAW